VLEKMLVCVACPEALKVATLPVNYNCWDSNQFMGLLFAFRVLYKQNRTDDLEDDASTSIILCWCIMDSKN